MTEAHHIAVLTGDLVNSTAMGQADIARAMATLADSASQIEQWTDRPLYFTRHRGDGWQVVLFDPKYALRSALFFRASLKALDARFDSAVGIAEGEIEGRIGPDLNRETSAPFILSGRALELAKRSRHHMNHARLGAHEAVAILTDRICRGWTQPQAAAMRHALQPDTSPGYTGIGEKLGKSRQAVAKALAAAWHEEVGMALTILEGDYP